MNILVTGGCGFIGSNLVRHLLFEPTAPPRKIVNLDKLTYAGNPANLADVASDNRYAFMQGGIEDEDLVAGLLKEYGIGAIINLAAESHVDRSIDSPEVFAQTNVIGTLRLLNTARRHWAGLPAGKKEAFRFLHVSTDEVYGSLPPNDRPFREDTAFAPNSPYAASKASSDHFVRAYQRTYGLPTLTTHCSNNYGPFQFPEKLIPLVILNALEGRALPVYGDGMQVRDWLFVEDHCRAISLVLRRGRAGETYNIGGINEMTNVDVVRLICSRLDERLPRKDGRRYAAQVEFVSDRPGHDRRYAIDCSKIRRELGWGPLESFATGLEKTVDWYLANRAWCAEITSKRYARERLGRSA